MNRTLEEWKKIIHSQLVINRAIIKDNDLWLKDFERMSRVDRYRKQREVMNGRGLM